MAVLKAKQPGVLKIEMTHVNDIRSVPRLLDIKSFNHDRKTGVLNSLINREAGICGLVVGDAAKEDFIIPAFPFYNLLRSQPVTAPSKSFSGSGNAAYNYHIPAKHLFRDFIEDAVCSLIDIKKPFTFLCSRWDSDGLFPGRVIGDRLRGLACGCQKSDDKKYEQR